MEWSCVFPVGFFFEGWKPDQVVGSWSCHLVCFKSELLRGDSLPQGRRARRVTQALRQHLIFPCVFSPSHFSVYRSWNQLTRTRANMASSVAWTQAGAPSRHHATQPKPRSNWAGRPACSQALKCGARAVSCSGYTVQRLPTSPGPGHVVFFKCPNKNSIPKILLPWEKGMSLFLGVFLIELFANFVPMSAPPSPMGVLHLFQ